MTRQEVETMLKATGYPVAFYEFRETERKELTRPFIAYLTGETTPLCLDGLVVLNIVPYDVELYTDEKDDGAEARLESVLKENGVTWSGKQEIPIPDQEMYECIYSFETEE